MPPLKASAERCAALTPKYWCTRWQLLYPAIKEHKIVQQLDQAGFPAYLEQIFVELETGVILLFLFPSQKILLLRADRAILQPFRIVSGKDELHG